MQRILVAAALVSLTAPALADGPSYNYIEGSYERAEIDVSGGDVDGDGFGIAGSFEIGDQVHLFAGFRSFDFDFNVDLDELTVGLGWHPALTDTTDLVFELGYVSAEAEAFGFDADEDGFRSSLGVRSMLSPQFELAGRLNYTDLGDGDDTSISGEGWYSLNEAFAIGGGIEFGDDTTIYGIGVRWYFNP